MPQKSSLREYHLLVARGEEGFTWQIRYDKHAKAVESSASSFGTYEEAERAGNQALAQLKAKLLDEG